MTFTQIVKDIFVRQPKTAADNANKGGAKKFLSRLSGAFMLPISVMAIAGLFLGVGAAIESHTDAVKFGWFLKNLGDPIFGAMPALFLVAIVISFTDDMGTAVFAGIVGFLVFNAIQQPFFEASGDGSIGTARFYGIDMGQDIAHKMYKIVGSNLGISSLNTAVFGGIIIGFVVSYLYNRFNQIELPAVIAFFGGKRFVPLVVIVAMIPFAFLFLLIWPFIGLGFAYFGEYSGKIHGVDSLLFGYTERALIPFGLHHVFYAPLWWTQAGGDMSKSLTDWTDANHFIVALDGAQTAAAGATVTDPTGATVTVAAGHQGINEFSKAVFFDAAGKQRTFLGDSFGWLAVNASGVKDVTFTTDGGAHTETMKIYKFIDKEFGIALGRFMQGKFAFMQLGLPAAGLGMVMAAPKENRKLAFAAIFPAAVTSFVTGVTEPIEFTFVFLAPALFWGFHAVMAALSFLAMNLLGAHVGMTFSGGFIDTIIYGAVPFSQGTNFYWMYAIGVVLAPIYFFVFRWAIVKFNLDTPGRGGNTKLFTKKDLQAAKAANSQGGISAQGAAIVAATGGWDNITKFSNCATRLRYDVKDNTIVDDAALKAAGAMGISRIGANHVQIIMGPVAEQINGNIKAHIGAPLGAAAAAPKAEVKAEAPKAAVKAKAVAVKSVAKGSVRTLASLKDGVFSEKMMGDGIVVCAPKTAKEADFFAPVSGELVTVFPTGHAYGIRTEEGLEVLVHIGIDTVALDGKGFTPAVKQGEMVKAGDKLATVDLDFVRKNAPTADAIVIVTSGQTLTKKATGAVTKASVLFEAK